MYIVLLNNFFFWINYIFINLKGCKVDFVRELVLILWSCGINLKEIEIRDLEWIWILWRMFWMFISLFFEDKVEIGVLEYD